MISASGAGEGTAALSACDATVLIIDGVPVDATTFVLTAGDFVSVTCGSTTVKVYIGPVDIRVPGQFTATVPSQVTVKVTKVDSVTVEVREFLRQQGQGGCCGPRRQVRAYSGDPCQTTEGPTTLGRPGLGHSHTGTTDAYIRAAYAHACANSGTGTAYADACADGHGDTNPYADAHTHGDGYTGTDGHRRAAHTDADANAHGHAGAAHADARSPASFGAGELGKRRIFGGGGGTGWLNPWDTAGGSATEVRTQDRPHGGSEHLRLRRAQGRASRDVDLSGRSGVHLQFWAKVSGFSAGHSAEVQVSPDGLTLYDSADLDRCRLRRGLPVL